MKNKIKQISFLLLIITAIFANFRLISSNDGITDTVLSSLIMNASAENEGPGGKIYWEELCTPCTNDYGQSGAKWGCEIVDYGTCPYVQGCQYGVC